MTEKLKVEIRKYNKTSIFKIRYRERKYDIALYLDLQRKNHRKTTNLNLFLKGKPSTLKEDKLVLIKAHNQQQINDKKFMLHNALLSNEKHFNIEKYFNYVRTYPESLPGNHQRCRYLNRMTGGHHQVE